MVSRVVLQFPFCLVSERVDAAGSHMRDVEHTSAPPVEPTPKVVEELARVDDLAVLKASSSVQARTADATPAGAGLIDHVSTSSTCPSEFESGARTALPMGVAPEGVVD